MKNENSKIDYSGRTVDLLLLKTLLYSPAVGQRVDLDVSGEPMIVSGVEKMVQRYAIAFLNAMGSTRFMPYHGTELVPQAMSGRIYNMATLTAAAAEANMLAMGQLESADYGIDTPDDERLVSSDVTDLKFSREEAKVKISVRLTTAAGRSFTYIIPVAVGVH